MVSERPEKRPGPTDVKSPTDEGQARRVESSGRGKKPPHTTKKDTAAQVWIRHTKHFGDHMLKHLKAPSCLLAVSHSSLFSLSC